MVTQQATVGTEVVRALAVTARLDRALANVLAGAERDGALALNARTKAQSVVDHARGLAELLDDDALDLTEARRWCNELRFLAAGAVGACEAMVQSEAVQLAQRAQVARSEYHT